MRLPLSHFLLQTHYPTMLPVAIVALVVATILGAPLARRLGSSRAVAWLLVSSFGVIMAATMAPSRLALTVGVSGPITCDLSRLGFAPLSSYLRIDDPIANVVIFVPLGLAIALLPRSRSRWALAGAAIALPFAIEATQAVIVAMDRACETGDIVDNLTGLFIGLLLGTLLRLALGRGDDRGAGLGTEATRRA